ncbi:Flp family type IVb pilin [Pseudomonas sp. MM211]|uniref:Flp family type IVb pilin n=1 Tax=Pseudomonas sp. MM211 TaxID=2866808 RepID=UPI001CEDDBE4|nr:Flp family type IVb pilin [Pseudomonas sp. MM211]UCJ17675.1 Flp family type IVb pilin [Pseudomonas sp. MM211]
MSTLIILREKVRKFFSREDGASAIEYSIIAGLIAVVIIASVGTLGKDINGVFTGISTELTKAKTTTTTTTTQ